MAKFSKPLKDAYPTFAFAGVEDAVQRATAARIDVSRASDVSPEAKIPFKTRTVLHCALRRNGETCDGFIRAFNVRLYTPLFVLARSALETGALAFDVWRTTESIVDANDVSALDDYNSRVMSILLGSRTDSVPGDCVEYPAPNVLTVIDRLAKQEVPHLRDIYDHLSEFAHPNYAGMLEAYTRPDLERRETTFVDTPFDDLEELVGVSVHSLAVGYGLSVLAVERYENRLGEFASLCERALYEAGTWPSDRPYPVER